MTPEEREALLASYALGTLSAPDVADAERLIQSDATAADEVAGFQEIAELIAFSAPLQQPPSALRDRVLAAARRKPSARRRLHIPLAKLLPAASMAAILAIVTVYAVNLQQELSALRDQTAVLNAVVQADAKRLDQLAAQPSAQADINVLETQLQQTQSATSILVDPEAESAEFVPTGAAHGASGVYTWSGSADAAVVVLRNLPALPFGDVYRVSLIDRWGNALAYTSVVPEVVGETMVLIATPAGARPQGALVFATNATSDSKLPDGLVVLEVTPGN